MSGLTPSTIRHRRRRRRVGSRPEASLRSSVARKQMTARPVAKNEHGLRQIFPSRGGGIPPYGSPRAVAETRKAGKVTSSGELNRVDTEHADATPSFATGPPRHRSTSRSSSSAARDIWLVDGATGKNRLCNDYDVTQQRCRVWAHTVHHSAPKKKATSGETSHTAASPAPAPAVAQTEKKEKSQ